MLDMGLRAFALLAAASLAAPLLRRTSPAVRHLYWHAVILATLILPLATTLAPAWRISPPPPIAQTLAGIATSIDVAGTPVRTSASDGALPAAAAPPPSSSPAPAAIAQAAWLAGSAVVVAMFALAHLRLSRIRSAARPAPQPWSDDAARIAARLRLRRAPEVRMSDDVPGPLAAGWLSPMLLIPSEAEDWTAGRREAVVAHELAHVARRDCRTLLAAQAVCAIHWFNPLAWRAARRLRSEQERACDAEALRFGITPSTYASELLAIASSLPPRRAPAAALAMARQSELEGRLLAVLAGGQPRRSAVARVTGVLTVTVLAMIVAGAHMTDASGDAVLPSRPIAAVPSMSDAGAGAGAGASAGARAGAGADADQAGAGAGAQARSNHAEALEALLKAIADRDADVREKAALAIGLWPDPRAAEALVKALADPDSQVREKAAIGLALRRRPEAAGVLIKALHDPDSQVREKAAIALGVSGDDRAGPALAAALNDPDPQVREKAAAALILLKSGGAGLAEGTLAAVVRLAMRALDHVTR